MDLPQQHDFEAAANYVSLLSKIDRHAFIKAMIDGDTEHHPAKDLIRASREPLLEADNEHVQRDLQKVHDGHELSPVIIVRGQFADNRPMIIADGYHRVCAAYWVSEDAIVKCRVV
jgi:hypothetical protein